MKAHSTTLPPAAATSRQAASAVPPGVERYQDLAMHYRALQVPESLRHTTVPTIPADLKPADGRFGCGPSKVRPEALAAPPAEAPAE